MSEIGEGFDRSVAVMATDKAASVLAAFLSGGIFAQVVCFSILGQPDSKGRSVYL